jgi:hypothetical protein
MAEKFDLNSSISAAQKEVDGWERQSRLASHARPVGPKWPMTLLMWVALALAVYAERGVLLGWLTPHDSTATVTQLSEVLTHAADDIEAYRSQYGQLPDAIPVDFLNGVLTYSHNDSSYTLETDYHDSLLRLRAEAEGPGAVEVLPR